MTPVFKSKVFFLCIHFSLFVAISCSVHFGAPRARTQVSMLCEWICLFLTTFSNHLFFFFGFFHFHCFFHVYQSPVAGITKCPKLGSLNNIVSQYILEAGRPRSGWLQSWFLLKDVRTNRFPSSLQTSAGLLPVWHSLACSSIIMIFAFIHMWHPSCGSVSKSVVF